MKLLNLYRPGDFFVSIKCTSFENAAYRVDRLVKKVNEFSSMISRIKSVQTLLCTRYTTFDPNFLLVGK